MKKKIFTLLTLALLVCSGAWAADYVVTATRELSNSNKTSTWSGIKANGGSAFQSSQTALGEGLYFVAAGKCTLDGGSSLNVKAKGEMYLEVPSASAAGTVKFTNGVNNRYMQTESGGMVHMKGDADNGDYKANLAFTSADIVDVDGVKYLKLTSKSDCKFKTVEITLTSGAYMTILATPTVTVAGATGTVTITPPSGATSVKYTTDGTEPSESNGTTYSAPFVADEGTVVKAIAIGDGSSYANSSVISKEVLLTGITMNQSTSVQYNGTVYLATTSSNASIYYTTDGSTPTSSSTLYKYPFTLEANATVKAVAVRTGCTNSDVETVNVNTVVSSEKTKTVYMGWGSFDATDAQALVGKSGDAAEGYGLSCNNDLQSGTQKNTSINKTFIKLPTNGQVTITLPTGVKATKVTLYSFINTNTSATVSGWKEINGVAYTEGDADYKNMPMGAFLDVDDYNEYPDVRTYALDNVTGSFTITSAGNQLCMLIALDVIEATMSATIGEAEYATFIPTTKVSVPDGVKAYIATAVDASAITLSGVSVIPANEPVIINGAAGTYAFPVSDADASAVTGNLLVAGPVTGDGESHYALGKPGSVVGFGLLKSGVVLPATKAYIPASAFGAGAPAFVPFSFAGSETTAISEAKVATVANGAVYNLNGQRVAQPTKGLYIINGKKVAIK